MDIRRSNVVALVALVLFVVGLLTGRATKTCPAPAAIAIKAHEETKAVEASTAHAETARIEATATTADAQKVQIVYRYRPNGSLASKTETASETKAASTTQATTVAKVDEAKERIVERNVEVEKLVTVAAAPINWHVSALVAWTELVAKPGVWGVSVERRILGPITVGVFGMGGNVKALGVSAGVWW